MRAAVTAGPGRRTTWGLATMLLVLAGCGDSKGSGATPAEVTPTGTAALTARAVAAVTLDHVADDTTHRQATYVDEHSPPGMVGADLRYNGDGESDGDLVRVTVARGKPEPCPSNSDCVELEGGVLLRWQRETPEEDSGVVGVELRRDGEVVTVYTAGTPITGDPRELELEPTVATMVELVQDPRLRLQTDAATVAAGEEVEEWEGGERDPESLEQVPNTDQTIVTGWIYAYGDAWKYVGPSPYKSEFGQDAIGGRVRVTGDLLPQSGFLDALAAPQPPPWLKSGCLEGYLCGTFTDGDDLEPSPAPSDPALNDNLLYVVWRPADGGDPGDAFLIHVRSSGETVAIHTVGKRMPEDLAAVAYAAGASGLAYDLTDPLSATPIGLTTIRTRFQQAAERTEGGNK